MRGSAVKATIRIMNIYNADLRTVSPPPAMRGASLGWVQLSGACAGTPVPRFFPLSQSLEPRSFIRIWPSTKVMKNSTMATAEA